MLLTLGPLLTVLLAPLAFAHQCDEAALLPEIARELRLPPAAFTHLQKSPTHAPTLAVIEELFTELDQEETDLDALSKRLSESADPASPRRPIAQNPFYQRFPEFIDEAAQETYLLLQNSALAARLSPEALGLLTYLAKGLPRNPFDRTVYRGKLTNAGRTEQMKNGADRTRVLFSIPRYREAIFAILKVPSGQHHFRVAFNQQLAAAKGVKLGVKDADEAMDRILRGSQNRNTLFYVQCYLTMFIYEISVFGTDHGFDSSRDEGQGVVSFFRRSMLSATEAYFATETQVKSSLGDITDTLDYFLFGTPLPKPGFTLRQTLLDRAKSFMQPLKDDYQRHAAEECRRQQAAPGPAVEPRKFEPKDMFAPKSAPHLRTRRAPPPPAAPLPNGQAAEDMIPPGEALREFTSISGHPRPMRELEAKRDYRFWFLRENKPALQTVRFDPSVVEFFRLREGVARQLLNSLHYGFARSIQQSGLKPVQTASSRHDGTVYELKAKGALRGLLVLKAGVWHFKMLIDREDLNHYAAIVTPIDD